MIIERDLLDNRGNTYGLSPFRRAFCYLRGLSLVTLGNAPRSISDITMKGGDLGLPMKSPFAFRRLNGKSDSMGISGNAGKA